MKGKRNQLFQKLLRKEKKYYDREKLLTGKKSEIEALEILFPEDFLPDYYNEIREK